MLFRFADHELDDEIFTLRRIGKDVPLRRQALDVLVYLVRHRDRVVTKRELLDAVWRGATVTDSTLPQAIVAVRRALDDDDEMPRAIQTVRGRGYRFIATVLTSDELQEQQHALGFGVDEPLAGGKRAGECATLVRDLLQSTAASRMAIVLVSGGAGVGKTRLLSEISRGVREKGARVIETRCRAPHDGTPDLWPWVELLRSCGEQKHPEATQLATELADQQDEPPANAASESAAARSRFLVFDRIVQVLQHAAEQDRLFVVIDDLHHADTASLLLLKLVATSLKDARIALVVAYRDGKQATFARTLGALAREQITRSIPLENLSRDDVAQLAASKLGTDSVDASLLDRLMEKSDGNPLLVIRILQAILREQQPRGEPNNNKSSTKTSALLALREMREAVALQLEDITPETRTMLSAASVLGVQFSLGRLASTISASSDKLLAPIEEALAARILKRTPEGIYRFTHLLVRDVLYRGLPLSERVTLHKGAGRAALEQNAPEDAIDHFERALRWLDRAAPTADDESELDAVHRANSLLALLDERPS